MTDIEKTKAQIKVLEKKLSLLEEIEKQPRMNLEQEGEYAVVSYHNKVYYRLEDKTTFSWYIKKDVSEYHVYYRSPNFVMVEDAETERLLEGLYYNHIQVKKEKEQRQKELVRESVKWCEEHPNENPLDWLKPQTPEQVADGLKEAFRTAIKEGIIPEVKQPTDELIEKLVKKPPEFLKFELGQSLTDLLFDWWEDVFTTNSDWDMETSIDDLVTRIEEWLPKYQSAAGSQSLGVVDMVEGFNDAIKKIKGKLR
jgi:hypothetical protein